MGWFAKAWGKVKSHLTVRLAAPTVKPTGVTGTGSVGTVSTSTGAAGTITAINRDTVASAGGASIIVTGTNITSVTVGGTAATITNTTGSNVTITAPAKTAGGPYDVTVNGGASLSGALTYLPSPTTTFAHATFEDDTFGTWTTGGTNITVSTDYAYAGTKCCKMVSGPGTDAEYLAKSHGNNPARAESEGLYTRFYLLLPQSTIDNVDNGGASGQIKLHLYRDFAGGADPDVKPGIVLGVGPEFRGNQLAIFADWNNIGLPGTRVDGSAFTNGDTGLTFVADVWNEIQIWQHHEGDSVGYAKLWVNGKRLVNTSHANLLGNNSGGGAAVSEPYATRLGIPHTEDGDGVVTVYIDNATVANGFIDP